MSKNTSKKDKKAEKDISQQSNINIKELQQELIDAQNSAKENWDKLLRSQAEIDNLRRRHSKDIENAYKFALEDFAKALLEVNDSLIMGLKAMDEKVITIPKIKEGVEITHKVLIDTLAKFNIKQVNPIGEKFNPESHEAVTMIPAEDKVTNDIVDVMQIGFTLNDRVIRPAMVIVAQ